MREEGFVRSAINLAYLRDMAKSLARTDNFQFRNDVPVTPSLIAMVAMAISVHTYEASGGIRADEALVAYALKSTTVGELRDAIANVIGQ